LLSVTQLPGLTPAALIVTGIAAAVWLDWLLRKLDRSRYRARQRLGTELRDLADNVEFAQARSKSEWPTNTNNLVPEIQSAFLKLKALGIQIPGQNVSQMNSPDFLIDYLRTAGVMLCDGHFDEAKRLAAVAVSQGPDDKRSTLLSAFWDGYDAAAKAVGAPLRKGPQQVRSTLLRSNRRSWRIFQCFAFVITALNERVLGYVGLGRRAYFQLSREQTIGTGASIRCAFGLVYSQEGIALLDSGEHASDHK
jgi:hypothetical protein